MIKCIKLKLSVTDKLTQREASASKIQGKYKTGFESKCRNDTELCKQANRNAGSDIGRI